MPAMKLKTAGKKFFKSFQELGIIPMPEHRSLTSNEGTAGENKFLRDIREKVHSFADIGCALAKGAPTTVFAKSILGDKVEVLAVDIEGNFSNPELRKIGIEPVKHNIVRAPLKKKVDVIRFSGVSVHMSAKERDRALKNIFQSLKWGGI